MPKYKTDYLSSETMERSKKSWCDPVQCIQCICGRGTKINSISVWQVDFWRIFDFSSLKQTIFKIVRKCQGALGNAAERLVKSGVQRVKPFTSA